MKVMGRRLGVHVATVAAVLGSCVVLVAGSGGTAVAIAPHLDPSFGVYGTTDAVTINWGLIPSVGIVPGGLAVGVRGPVVAGLLDTRVEGFTTTGSVDAGFGTNGFADLPPNFSAGRVFSMSDGHLLALGTSFSSDVVVRLDSTGQPQPWFFGDPLMGAGSDRIVDVGARPGGGFYLLETLFLSGALEIFAFGPDGRPSTSFGVNGAIPLDNSASTGRPTRVTFASDGSFVVFSFTPTNHSFLTRYSATGSIEPSFGTAGSLDLGQVIVTGLAVLEDNGLAVSAANAGVADGFVHRIILTASGAISSSVDIAGIQVANCAISLRTDHNVLARPGGGALFVGDAETGGTCAGTTAFIEVYRPDGQPDTSFSELGLVLIDGHSGLYSAIDELGRVYVGGRTLFTNVPPGDDRLTRVTDVSFAHFESLQPARLLETRRGPGLVTVDHQFEGIGALPAGSTTTMWVAGRTGVPFGARAVALNVTAVDAQGPGYLTVYPCGPNRPLASNVNYTTNQTVPNSVITQLGPNGEICIYTQAATDLIIDINGYFPAGTAFGSVTPARLLETRLGPGLFTVDHQFEGIGQRNPLSTTTIPVAGRGAIPANAKAVVLNVTAVDAQGPGYLTVYPCGPNRPLASNVNYTTNQTVPNSVIIQLGPNGEICIYTQAATDLIIDINGYFP